MSLSVSRHWLVLGTLVVVALVAAVTVWLMWPRPPQPPVLVLDGIDASVADALRSARAAVQSQPNKSATWGELGELLFANELHAEALECFRHAERLDAREVRWPYLQGLILLGRDPDEALTPLGRAAEHYPDTIAPRLRLAEVYLARDDLDEAEKRFTALRELEPNHPRILLGLAQIAQRRDRWAESIPLLQKASASPFAKKAALTALAIAQQRLGKPDEAAQHNREADDAQADLPWLDPYLAGIDARRTSLPARIIRIDMLLRTNELDLALSLLRDLLRDHPTFDEGRLKLAQALIRRNDVEQAEMELRRLIADHPNLPDGYFLLGTILLQRRNDEAERHLRKAVTLRPGYAMAHLNLGRCLQQQKKPDEARTAYLDALRYRPHLRGAHVALAGLLRDRGDLDAARAHLQQALRLDPNDAEAKKLAETLKP